MKVLESLIPVLARAVAALLLSAATLDGFARPAPRLIYAVVFARHGVRAPTWTMDRLRQWSAEDWPSFGVAPGELTPHGREAIQRLGAYYREWMTREGLIGGCGDASHLFVRADKDQRTVETAHAFAGALLPGCSVPVHDGAPTIRSSIPWAPGTCRPIRRRLPATRAPGSAPKPRERVYAIEAGIRRAAACADERRRGRAHAR